MMDEADYEALPTSSVPVHMIAGGLAGIMEHCVMYPVDSVKTRLQSLTHADLSASRNLGSVFGHMVREEGLLRPFRGMGAVVIGAGPAHALYFSAYEKLKVLLSESGSANHSPLAQGAAAATATLFHDGIMTPADAIKQRLQMYHSPYRSLFHCASSVYRSEGFRAFYRSYGTQILMNIPFQCIHFVVYESMQNVTNPQRNYNPLGHMLSGAVAGATAAAVTTPLDVCKTLLNTQEAGALEKLKRKRIIGFFNAFRTVNQLGGLAGYFQGLQARVLYQAPSTAICWSVYEFFKFILASGKKESSDDLSEAAGPSLPNQNARALDKL